MTPCQQIYFFIVYATYLNLHTAAAAAVVARVRAAWASAT